MTWARHRRILDAIPTKCYTTLPSRISGTAWRSVARRSYAAGHEKAQTEVERILLDMIKATGPISFATYMQMCLSHPVTGYYINPSNPILGSRGDFITSPEISQAFGELLGIWLLSQWMHAGHSRKIRLVELGPGRGTLMHDVLRVFAQFDAARSATTEIHLVETSLSMRSAQESKLSALAQAKKWGLTWHDSVEGIPHDASVFTLVLAHEFFDALPFHLLQRTDKGWNEVRITSEAEAAVQTTLRPAEKPSLDFSSVSSTLNLRPRFRPVLSPTPTASSSLLGLSSPRFQKLPLGSRIEVSPAAFKISRQIAQLLHDPHKSGTRSAGSALIVDYGGNKVYGNSFRAFKDHKIVDVFHRPGECDLTVNVDFAYLQEAAAGLAAHHGPVSQAVFLIGMGLEARIKALRAAAKDDERKKQIEHAAHRLVSLTGMGSQYQVMALTGQRSGRLSQEERWPFLDPKEMP